MEQALPALRHQTQMVRRETREARVGLEDFVRRVAVAATVRQAVIPVRGALVVMQTALLEVLPVMAVVWAGTAQAVIVEIPPRVVMLPAAISPLVVRLAELAAASALEVAVAVVEIACMAAEATARMVYPLQQAPQAVREQDMAVVVAELVDVEDLGVVELA